VPAQRCRAARLLLPAMAAAAVLLTAGLPMARAGLSEAIERVKPSVVAVGTYQKTRSPAFAFRGSGFAVDDGTLIATAAHVVPDALPSEPRTTMMVIVQLRGAGEPQGRDATVVAIDKLHDVALLRIGGIPLPTVTLGRASPVRDGLAIAFTGFPIGNALGFHPVTHRGIIAAQPPIVLPTSNAKQLDANFIRSVKAGPFNIFQLDATAYPGHSGSPLYDADTAEVIGIVNMSVKATKDAAVGQATGISFAVPVQYLQDLLRVAR
jgi:serine protease Do